MTPVLAIRVTWSGNPWIQANTAIRGGRRRAVLSQSQMVATQPPDLRGSGRFTVVNGRSPSLSSHDVPAGLRMVRALDRAVLEVARGLDLRPMELYALLLLHGAEPIETTRLADQLSASPSQAKQLALRLCARGIAVRRGAFGRTELTDAGRELALEAEARLEDVVAGRMAGMDPTLRVLGGATLADMTLPSLA